jgi:hypothetical protein
VGIGTITAITTAADRVSTIRNAAPPPDWAAAFFV